MQGKKLPLKRRYDAPRRRAAAKRTRQRILTAAKAEFEVKGWSGATMAAIAERAAVSLKTVELAFGTKPALLSAVVDLAIRGDAEAVPVFERPNSRAIEEAPDAEAMLVLHVEYVVAIVSRSAQIAAVVESAAQAGGPPAGLWNQMNANRRLGARWAAENLVGKPGVRSDVRVEEAEQIFLLTIGWDAYRLATRELGLEEAEVSQWLLRLYRRCFLPEARP
jgi:AcrR family transcriptional regulator